MNIVDSSAWIEYFKGTKNAKNFRKTIQDHKNLLIPAIIIYEVFKYTLLAENTEKALEIIANMREGKIIDIDLEISLLAAQISNSNKLAMADSLILACAQKYNATLWTTDKDFKNLPNVKYFEKS